MKHYLGFPIGKTQHAVGRSLGFVLLIATITAITTPLFSQSLTIQDACTCREFSIGSAGNATNTSNGQFSETIEIISNPGEDWYIESNIGFFDIASPQPPFTPLSYMTGPAGVALTEGPAGVYTLDGIHVDGVGYDITLTNGISSLTVSNTCAYPNPVITSPTANGFCPQSDPVSLTADNNGATGVGTFDLLENGSSTVIAADISVVDPAALPLGSYILRYTFDEDEPPGLPCMDCNPGCAQSVFKTIEIAEPPASIACNDDVQVSLGTDCTGEVLPDMLLEGDQNYALFEVELFENGIPIGNVVTNAQIGQSILGVVSENCTGLSCMTVVIVEDKRSPEIDCPVSPIQISCIEDPEAVPLPTAEDACEGPVAIDLIFNNEQNFSCGDANGVLKRITSIYAAEDSKGNTAIPCEVVIEIMKNTLADVVLPPNRDDVAAPALECLTTDTGPSITGFPTINGEPIDGDDLCTISATFTDEDLDGCGGSSKINRTWTIYDYCSPTAVGINPIIHTQVIKIADNTAPLVEAPQDLTIGAFNSNCTADFLLPAANISDACSAFSVNTITPVGLLAGNGGLVTGLNLGSYLIFYNATDECGNTGSDFMTLTVVDNVEPTPICDEITTVTLNQSGDGELLASDPDDGSFDNCTSISFEIRRLDISDDFGPVVTFDCTDGGDTIMVEILISDTNNNANSCEVSVIVENTFQPAITCPSDITVDCATPVSTNNTGLATATSECQIASISFEDIVNNTNDCGTGFIVRQFTAQEITGPESICLQTITIEADDPLTSSDIDFPENYIVASCDGPDDLLPENLPNTPVNYSFPIVNAGTCTDVMVSYEDNIVTSTGTACFIIERAWLVIDICDPNSSFTSVQFIEVIDNTAPEIVCPNNQTIELPADECETTVMVSDPVVTDCSDNITVVVSNDIGTGTGTFDNVAIGSYPIAYFVNDNCGNVASCSYMIIVRDTVDPVLVCDLVPNITIDASGSTVIPASYFGAGSMDNCTAGEDLIFSYNPLNPNDSLITVDCDDSGSNFFVSITLLDASGNSAQCSSSVFIEPCDDQLVGITGTVFTEQDNGVNEVVVDLNGVSNPGVMTNEDGEYFIADILAGSDITLVPQKTDEADNGTTASDLAILTKHILNIQTLSSPYKLIAADANGNGFVSTTDVVAIRKVILQLSDQFPNDVPNWRFVDASYEFINPLNPFQEDYPQIISFNNITEDQVADFIAIKTGDLNGNANTQGLWTTDDRNDNRAILFAENQRFQQGEIVQIPFSFGESNKELISSQFTIAFDGMTIDRIEGWQPESYYIDETAQEIRFCGIGAEISTKKWTIIGKANRDGQLSEMIKTSDRIAAEITFANDPMIYEQIEWNFTERESFGEPVFNYPNPFQHQTILEFSIETAETAVLMIFDSTGKLVLEKETITTKGINRMTVNGAALPCAGVYYYQIKITDRLLTGKMIYSPH